MGGILAATDLLLGLFDRATTIANLIKTAQSEGRDITAAELQALVSADDAARTALQTAIDNAKAAG